MMRTVFGIVLAVAVMITFLPASATAYDFDVVSDDDWETGHDSSAPSADAIMIFERVWMDDTRLGKGEVYLGVHRRIRVIGSEGRDWGDVVIPYYHDDQELKKVTGRSVRRNGDETILDPKSVIEKEVVRSKRRTIEQKSFSIPGVSSDCIIDYYFRLKIPSNITVWPIQKDIPLREWRLEWKLFKLDRGYFSSFKRLSFLLNVGRRTPNYLLDPTIEIGVERLPSIKDTKKLIFSAKDILPFDLEPNSLPADYLRAGVRVYYGSPGSSEAYWGNFADLQYTATNAWIDENKKIKKWIKRFSSTDSTNGLSRDVYKWLQDSMRNVDWDCYGCDQEKIAKKYETIDKALKNRIADSDMINMIYYAALRELNIDAKLAWVADRDEDLLVRDAKYWQFDRSLVLVPRADAGSDFCAPGQLFLNYGQIAWYNEGIRALVPGDMNATFRTTPFTESSDNSTTRSIELALSDGLDLTGWWQERIVGYRARSLRCRLYDKEDAEKLAIVKEMVEEKMPDARIDSISVEGLDNDYEPISIQCFVSYPSVEEKLVGGRLVLNPLEYLETQQNPFTADQRVHAIVYSYAHQLRQSLSIELPDGWTIEGIPGDTSLTKSVGSCGVNFGAFVNQLTVQSSFVINSPFNSVEQYPELQELYSTHNRLGKMTVSLTQRETSRNE